MRSWLSDRAFENRLFVPVLLFSVVLACYYPALFSGINPVDDARICAFYASPPPLSHVLLPAGNYYFRPLIELSFYLDSRLWGMEPCAMHLENILLHGMNVLLVYLLARRISRKFPGESTLVPLFAALLFALHPLNVEAVAWIAGRTDPLMAFFLLCACYFWLRWLDEPNWRVGAGSAVFFVLGVLTKETALAFLPVAMLLAVKWPGPARPWRLRLVAVLGVCGVLVVLAVALRGGAGGAVAQALQPGDAAFLRLVPDALVAFGFYVKKLVLPLPLNFAIVEVSPWYGLLGAGALLGLAALLKGRRLAPLFLAAAALMVTPALVVATRQVSWTPYAERYMYLPTAFLSLGGCCILRSQEQVLLKRGAAILVLIIAVAAGSTVQRTLLWQDKLSFYRHALAQSPGFGSLYNELGSLYLQRNEPGKAAEAFAAADRLNTRPSMRNLIKSNMMAALVAKGEFAAARAYFFTIFPDKKQAPVQFLELLQQADGRRSPALAADERSALQRDLLETFSLLYDKTKEPFWLYQSGKTARALGLYPEALQFFRTAYAQAPADAHYRGAARTQMLNLEGMQ